MERRQKPRPVSTIRLILDVTFTVIRKTSKKSDCFKIEVNKVKMK